MPYRPKISEILPTSSLYQFQRVYMIDGKKYRTYKINGNVNHSTIISLVTNGFQVFAIGGTLKVIRPSQIRSYKTE